MPELNDEFRERMEDVLDQYDKPLDPSEPVVCLDEQPYQMVDDARPPEPAAPGDGTHGFVAGRQPINPRPVEIGSLPGRIAGAAGRIVYTP